MNHFKFDKTISSSFIHSSSVTIIQSKVGMNLESITGSLGIPQGIPTQTGGLGHQGGVQGKELIFLKTHLHLVIGHFRNCWPQKFNPKLTTRMHISRGLNLLSNPALKLQCVCELCFYYTVGSICSPQFNKSQLFSYCGDHFSSSHKDLWTQWKK